MQVGTKLSCAEGEQACDPGSNEAKGYKAQVGILCPTMRARKEHTLKDDCVWRSWGLASIFGAHPGAER